MKVEIDTSSVSKFINSHLPLVILACFVGLAVQAIIWNMWGIGIGFSVFSLGLFIKIINDVP